MIAGAVVRTPLLPFPGAGGELWLKPENLQRTGSFKLRGAYHAVSRVPAEHRAVGVITHSSGNHGRALAYAARAFGVPCVVVMPGIAPAVKVDAVRALGAEVVLVPAAEREPTVAALVAQRGLVPVPPYDHRDIIAGQGTVGLEIVEDVPDVDLVLVPVGGGGLSSGLAAAVKSVRPAATVLGVEPELAADAQDSLRAGTWTPWPVELTTRTVADGLRTSLSQLTYDHLSARLDGVVTVTEDEILAAVGELARSAKLVAEPSGAVAVAAFLHGRVPAGRTVAVITGGNADPGLLAKAIENCRT